MSQLSKLVQVLKSSSVYELAGDMPLFSSALSEIEQRLEKLENPPVVHTPVLHQFGRITPVEALETKL